MGGFFMQPSKPIKPFVKIRAQSIADQLAGKTEGQNIGEPGFGPPGVGPGRGFGPGMFLAGAFMKALDTNQDGQIAKNEFAISFPQWFESWNKEKAEALSDEKLRAGIDQDLAPRFGGPGGFPPPGPPQ